VERAGQGPLSGKGVAPFSLTRAKNSFTIASCLGSVVRMKESYLSHAKLSAESSRGERGWFRCRRSAFSGRPDSELSPQLLKFRNDAVTEFERSLARALRRGRDLLACKFGIVRVKLGE